MTNSIAHKDNKHQEKPSYCSSDGDQYRCSKAFFNSFGWRHRTYFCVALSMANFAKTTAEPTRFITQFHPHTASVKRLRQKMNDRSVTAPVLWSYISWDRLVSSLATVKYNSIPRRAIEILRLWISPGDRQGRIRILFTPGTAIQYYRRLWCWNGCPEFSFNCFTVGTEWIF